VHSVHGMVCLLPVVCCWIEMLLSDVHQCVRAAQRRPTQAATGATTGQIFVGTITWVKKETLMRLCRYTVNVLSSKGYRRIKHRDIL
jgi:hypothetical protein